MRKALIPAFLLVLGSVILGAVLREPIARAATPFTNVIVGNTTTNPVPVAVQNTDTNGNVKVHEQGTANVTVANTPTVSVASSAANPLDVSNVNDGRNPYSDYEIDSTSSGSHLGPCFAAVPAGETLVLETTSVQIKVPVGIGVTRASLGSAAFLAPAKIGSDGTYDFYATTQPMRSYVSEGTSICLNVDLTKPVSSFTTLEAEADGYLVPNS